MCEEESEYILFTFRLQWQRFEVRGLVAYTIGLLLLSNKKTSINPIFDLSHQTHVNFEYGIKLPNFNLYCNYFLNDPRTCCCVI